MMQATEKKISTIAGDGTKGFSGDDGLAIHSQLNRPFGVSIHPHSGDIYISDYGNHRIRKISSSNGKISTIAGNGQEGFNDDGLAINVQLCGPDGIAIHPHSGDIYFCDRNNHRIRKISSNGIITTIVGDGTNGFSGDGELAINAQLNEPCGIAIHPHSGDIYISDYGNHRIRKISSSNGKISTIAGNDPQLGCPDGIAIHPHSGDIYFCDSSGIGKISPSSGKISAIVGYGIKGFNGDGELAINAQLNEPSGIAIDSYTGDIYFCDCCNHRIRKISSLNGIISTIAGNGKKGFNGDDVLAINAQVHYPFGIAIHPTSGDIYFVDSRNNRIRKIQNNIAMNHVFKLKKNDRDIIKGTSITCCKCVINIIWPNMLKMISNEQLLNHLNGTNHQRIIQHLIDLLIYDGHDNWVDNYELIDVLFILGLIINTSNTTPNSDVYNDIINLTRKLIDNFTNYTNDETCPLVLEQLTKLKDHFSSFENSLLDQMLDYCLDKAVDMLRKSGEAVEMEIIRKNILKIAARMSKQKCMITINDNDKPKIENKITFESLFNDKKTSDIIIKIGNNEYHSHKTIISSKSTYYEALFNSGFEYQDLKDNIHTVDTNEFDENSQTIILQYCYGIFDSESISDLTNIPLFKCAQFHGMKELATIYARKLRITVDTYLYLVKELGTDNEILLEHFIQFAMNHPKQLLDNRETLEKIPNELKTEIILRLREYHR